jgi:hypothetical protein
MLGRLLYLVLGTAALIGVLWLEETGNYAALLVLAGVALLVLFFACAFLFVVSAPTRSGIIERALDRRSARAMTKELLARVGQK